MSDWEELVGKSNTLFEDAKVIVMKGNDATASEKENLQKMIDDAQALKKRALQLKEVDAGLLGLQELPHGEDPTSDKFKQKANEVAGEFKNWEEFLEAIWMKQSQGVEDKRLVWMATQAIEGHEKKSMAGTSGASGGFLMQPQFLSALYSVLAEEGIVRAGASVIRMAGRQLAVPVLDQSKALGVGLPNWFGGMKFYWADEGAQKTESDATFRQVNLVAKKLYGYTSASNEMVADSAISLADFLNGPLGFSGGIVWMEDFSFLRGVGGAQPRGIVPAPATLIVPRQLANSVSYVDCINMLQEFLPSGRGGWVASQSILSEMIQMSGPSTNPSYVWQPDARPGISGTLFGMPVKFSEKMYPKGTKGDLLLADFRYYIIGDRQATTIEASGYPRWAYDETTWRVVHRVDGQPWLSAPLTYQDASTQVSPFVVLGSTAGS